jgi:hypothetical protein
MNCVICLEQNDNKFNPSCPAVFKCYTCNEGFVCNNCIHKFDTYGSIFEGTLEEVKKVIKCPCCRTLNWNYHFNMIIQITFDLDENTLDELPKNGLCRNDACHLMIKNKNL